MPPSGLRPLTLSMLFTLGLAAKAEPHDALLVVRNSDVGQTSPDGAWHAYNDPRRGVRLFDIAHRRPGATLGTLVGRSGCTSFAWSPDSQLLAYPVDPRGKLVSDDLRVAVFDLRSGKTRIDDGPNRCTFEFDARGALRAPASANSAYVFSPRNSTRVTSIVRTDLATGATQELAPLLASQMFDPRVDPRGRLCVFIQAGLRCLAPGAQVAEVVPTPVTMPGWPGTVSESPFSPDGERLVFVDHTTRQLWLWDRASGASRLIHANKALYRSVTFLNGDRVLLSDPAYRAQPLVELELSSGATTLVAGPAQWTTPSLAPSSGVLFIGRERNAQRDLWVLYPRRPAKKEGRRIPVLAPSDALFQRQERPDLPNACTSDADCYASGCSPACTAVPEVFDACRDAPVPPIGACGCVAGACQWFRAEPYAGPGSRGQPCFDELFCLPGLSCRGNAPGSCEPPPSR